MAIIEPYMAVGLVTTVWGARTRADIERNIEHIHGVMKAAAWLSSLDYPVRYVAVYLRPDFLTLPSFWRSPRTRYM